MSTSFYRPQTKFAKVMFLHVYVFCPCGGGGSALGGCLLGGGGLVPGGEDLQDHNQGGNLGGSVPGPHPRGKLRGIRSRPTPKGEIEGESGPAPLMATAAGSTHPTGMHSCSP